MAQQDNKERMVFMKLMFCVLIAYLLGSLSPSALISKLKNTNLRQSGTGNLGATNVMLNFGKAFGALVMVFDIGKAYFSVRMAAVIFPGSTMIPLIAGGAAMVGHMFPFYMKFKGGKGLATFGGLVLAFNPMIFLVMLIAALTAMLITNYAVAMPVFGAILLPIFTALHTMSIGTSVVAIVIGAILILRHTENISDALTGTAPKIREYIKNELISH